MGNWRTVMISGSVAADEVPALLAAVRYTDKDWDNFGPLAYGQTPSLCGLHDWVRPTVQAAGNLAERDYGPEDVAEHLRKLLAVAPSLRVKVHCGADWEKPECVATVTVSRGAVTVGPPEVETVHGVSESESTGRLMGYLFR